MAEIVTPGKEQGHDAENQSFHSPAGAQFETQTCIHGLFANV